MNNSFYDSPYHPEAIIKIAVSFLASFSVLKYDAISIVGNVHRTIDKNGV